MSVLAFLLACAVFILLLLAIPFEFRVTYRRVNRDDSAIIQLTGFFGLWKYKIDIPMMDWRWAIPPHLRMETKIEPSTGKQQVIKEELKPGKPGLPQIIGRFFSTLLKAIKVRRWFYKGISCKHLRWIMEYGTKDAAYTGIAVGGLWSVIGYYVGKLHDNVTFQVPKPQVAVYPSFNKPLFKVDFDCIFNLRIGHIIIAGFKVLKIVKVVLRG